MPLQDRTTPEDALITCRGLTSGLAILVALVQLHPVLVVEEASALPYDSQRPGSTPLTRSLTDMVCVVLCKLPLGRNVIA
jgi:hypothetical protein